ncbi:MAG: tetratricopeptide repeat protein [Actinomycetota bacterium]
MKRFSVGRLAAVIAVVAAASCTPHPSDEQAARNDPVPQEGALGAFLAGRFAQAHGDTRAAADFYAEALRHDPENTELLGRAFTLLIAEGRLDDAVPLAERLLSFDADAAMPAMALGVREARDGRFAAAEKYFVGLPKKGLNGFLGPLLTSWARVGQGRTDAALEALAPLANTSGLAPVYEFHAGLIDDLAGRTADAEQHYQTALAGQGSLRAIEAAGSLFLRTGRPDRARELYGRFTARGTERLLLDPDRALAAGPGAARPVDSPRAGLAEALFDTATLMRQGNALDMSLVFSQLALALEPKAELPQLLIGDVLAAQGRLAESTARYRAIDSASPASAFARMRVAVNLDDGGDTNGAVAELKAVAARLPTDTDALMTMGDLLRRHKRFAEAADAYGQAVDRVGPKPEPRQWTLYYARGIALERSGQWGKAEGDFLKALELRPDQPDVLNYLGYTWVDQGVNLERGRKMIERAVELRPNDGAIVDSLGWALYRMGEFANAVKFLERAVELKPEDPTINDHLGDALWQVGRAAEARFQWNRALTLEPDPDQVAPIRAKVETGMLPAKPLAQ